jgi:branched-subunit amino acid transport protein
VTEVWVTIAVLTVTTAMIRAFGPALLGGRQLPRRATDVIVLLAPALLAALVVVQTLAAPEGGELDVDERVVGVAAGGIVLWRGGSALLTVGVAAAVTAGLRALL